VREWLGGKGKLMGASRLSVSPSERAGSGVGYGGVAVWAGLGLGGAVGAPMGVEPTWATRVKRAMVGWFGLGWLGTLSPS